jgi:hypothetical protein
MGVVFFNWKAATKAANWEKEVDEKVQRNRATNNIISPISTAPSKSFVSLNINDTKGSPTKRFASSLNTVQFSPSNFATTLRNTGSIRSTSLLSKRLPEPTNSQFANPATMGFVSLHEFSRLDQEREREATSKFNINTSASSASSINSSLNSSFGGLGSRGKLKQLEIAMVIDQDKAKRLKRLRNRVAREHEINKNLEKRG